MAKHRKYFICPHCGEKVPEGAAACRHCGSDAETGWSDAADDFDAGIADGYDSDDDFDYEEFIAREFPGQASPRPQAALKKAILAIVVILVVLGLVFATLLH